MALSSYAQYTKRGRLRSLEGFLFGQANGKIPTFDLRFFEYHKLVAVYRQLFGEDRVLVLPFELLRESPAEYVGRLRSFCGLAGAFETPPGTPLNRAHPAFALWLMRQLNPLRKADVLNGFSPWASKCGRKIIDRPCRAAGRDAFASLNARIAQRWRERVDEALAGRFAASNARLAQNTGLPLAEYGYDLPPAPALGRCAPSTHARERLNAARDPSPADAFDHAGQQQTPQEGPGAGPLRLEE